MDLTYNPNTYSVYNYFLDKNINHKWKFKFVEKTEIDVGDHKRIFYPDMFVLSNWYNGSPKGECIIEKQGFYKIKLNYKDGKYEEEPDVEFMTEEYEKIKLAAKEIREYYDTSIIEKKKPVPPQGQESSSSKPLLPKTFARKSSGTLNIHKEVKFDEEKIYRYSNGMIRKFPTGSVLSCVYVNNVPIGVAELTISLEEDHIQPDSMKVIIKMNYDQENGNYKTPWDLEFKNCKSLDQIVTLNNIVDEYYETHLFKEGESRCRSCRKNLNLFMNSTYCRICYSLAKDGKIDKIECVDCYRYLPVNDFYKSNCHVKYVTRCKKCYNVKYSQSK